MRAIVCLALCIPLFAVAQAPTVGMGKLDPWVLGTSDEWPLVEERLDELQLFIDQIPKASPEALRRLVERCEANGIRLVVELGGLVDWRADEGGQSGERSFKDEVAKVKPLTDPVAEGGAGGRLHAIHMDGPIRRMLYPMNEETGHHTVGSAADELVDAMRLWREAYPDLRFRLLTNFPNWGWKGGPAYNDFGFAPGEAGWGDYHAAVQTVLSKTDAAGLAFEGLVVDNPYDYAIGERPSNQPGVTEHVDWMARLRDLEGFARSEGLRYILIVNSERGGMADSGSDARYFRDTLAYLKAYREAGGTPEGWHFESWYPLPEEWVPETEPHTMTYLVREALERLTTAGSPSGEGADD